MTIRPLCGCLPEIIVTMEDIRVVDGHHFVAANFDGQLFHDGTAQVLNYSPVGILAGHRDREGQPRRPGDNHIVFAKVEEPDKQLLVLIDAAWIVGDDHSLPNSSLGLTGYTRKGLSSSAVKAVQQVDKTLPSNLDNIELEGLSGIADSARQSPEQ